MLLVGTPTADEAVSRRLRSLPIRRVRVRRAVPLDTQHAHTVVVEGVVGTGTSNPAGRFMDELPDESGVPKFSTCTRGAESGTPANALTLLACQADAGAP